MPPWCYNRTCFTLYGAPVLLYKLYGSWALYRLPNITTPSQGTVRRFFWCILPSKYAPGAPQASRGGGRGQHQPKPGFGHAMAVLATFALKVERSRFKLPSHRKRSRKRTQKYRRSLAWKRAPQLHPKADPGFFCQIGPAPGGGRFLSDPGWARDRRDSHRRFKSRRIFSTFLC